MLSLVFGPVPARKEDTINYGRLTHDDDETHRALIDVSHSEVPSTAPAAKPSAPSKSPHTDLISFDSDSFTAGTQSSVPALPHIACSTSQQAAQADDWAAFLAERHSPAPPNTASTPGSSNSAQTAVFDELMPGLTATSSPASPSVIEAINTPMPLQDNKASSIELEGPDGPLDRRELLIYAIPLCKDNLVFLPVTAWREEPQEPTGWLQKKVSTVSSKVSDTFNSMGQAEANTISNKLYTFGRRIMDSMTPEERLMHNIPQKATKVIIYHPSQVLPDAIMEKLTTVTEQYGTAAVAKASVAGLLLPLAFGIDIVILPGPSLLTYYTAWEMYKNASGVRGQQRLRSYVLQQGVDKVRVNYAGEPKLDKYADASRDSPDGVLGEEDIEELCREVNEPDLLAPLLALREQHVRKQPKRTADNGVGSYSVLPTSYNDDPSFVKGP